jgi:hypothetical protein
MNESGAKRSEHADNVRAIPPDEVAKATSPHGFRLGHDARFLLVAVGGGAMRVARSAARQAVPYLETVAINGDDRVVEALDFHRRMRVELPRDGGVDAEGSNVVVALPQLQQELEQVFEGTTFVTIVASLGGGAGTEVLPSVLEAAARHAPFLSVFVLKPFLCEEERRTLADRSLEAIRSQGAFAERVHRNEAALRVMDNELAVPTQGRRPFNQLDRLWGDLVAAHIRDHFVAPAESALEEYRLAREAREPLNLPEGPSAPTPGGPSSIPPGISPMPDSLAPPLAVEAPPASPSDPGPGLEILLEICPDPSPVPRAPSA